MTPLSADRSWEYLPDIFGGIESISDALAIRERGLFLLTDANGEVPAGNGRGLGLYHNDTRHLSNLSFTLNGAAPVVLLSNADAGFSMEQVMGNHRAVSEDRFSVGRCTVEIARLRVMGEGLEERLTITNYNPFPVAVLPAYAFEADFADIFEVRGHVRSQRGHLLAPEVGDDYVLFSYHGLDGVMRETRVVFDRRPAELTPNQATFALDLAPREQVELRWRVLVHHNEPVSRSAATFHSMASDYARWRETFAFVHTDNEVFNRVLERSLTDLRMLWTRERDGDGYFAAGTPWFDALFGRDSLITALQTLPYRPDLARETLFLLARLQGRRVEPFSAEEPGKILHEMRRDELAAIGELPYGRYYGSVDSTPLFLLLAGEYFMATGDVPAMRALRGSLVAGLHWVRDFGAPDADGYLKYHTSSPTGLRNQGWKDSENCIVHANGELCHGPIALAEVQGYYYAALQLLSRVFEALDDPGEAMRLRLEAAKLGKNFRGDFWIESSGLVPMALDGQGAQAAVMSSNAGQVLWSMILEKQQAEGVRDALFRSDMFTGWGIRTLSSDNPSFNPVGYHVGTIWPHDNAIIAAGLKRNGFDEEVGEIATALFDTACQSSSLRLPEVYGGHLRSAYQPPVPYPVACRPQAWASGAMLHLLSSLLGIAPDAPHHKLYLVRPRLPYWLTEVSVRGMRVGAGSVDLTFKREHGQTNAHVDRAEGVSVVHSTTWPHA